MNTYEPTPTKRIKQRVSEELLKFIARITFTKSDAKKINDIDVSGCPYYIDSDGSCSSHDCECIKCIHNACFYKDYKAKEQECEKLKATLKVIADRPCLNIN